MALWSLSLTPLDHWAAWLAEDDGIPQAVQPMFDMAEYYAAAREILEAIHDA